MPKLSESRSVPVDDGKISPAVFGRGCSHLRRCSASTANRGSGTERRQIKAAAARKKIEDAVEDAVSRGKITVARKTHWVNLITADPAMAEVLASASNETAVPLTEVGYGKTDEDVDNIAADTWF